MCNIKERLDWLEIYDVCDVTAVTITRSTLTIEIPREKEFPTSFVQGIRDTGQHTGDRRQRQRAGICECTLRAQHLGGRKLTQTECDDVQLVLIF